MPIEELHFEHAPIVEALITIEVQPLTDASMLALEATARAVQPDYPTSEPLNQFEIQVGLNIQAGFIPQQTIAHDPRFGFKLVSSDKRQLAVFRRNGFGFSRLPPYETWGTFRDEARRLWNLFRAAAGEVTFTGFGLRYINRLYIPVAERIDNFLRLYPEVPNNPDGSTPTIHGLYMRLDSNLEEPTGHLIIQEAMLPTERHDSATISLDFDLRYPTPAACTEDFVWETLEGARQKKNHLFVNSLTPTFLETFR